MCRFMHGSIASPVGFLCLAHAQDRPLETHQSVHWFRKSSFCKKWVRCVLYHQLPDSAG